MLKTRLISLAAIAAVIVSGTATAMAATSDHPKQKTTHATQAANKQTPKSKARTGPAPAQQPSGAHDNGYN
jgi:hypothetical protein